MGTIQASITPKCSRPTYLWSIEQPTAFVTEPGWGWAAGPKPSFNAVWILALCERMYLVLWVIRHCSTTLFESGSYSMSLPVTSVCSQRQIRTCFYMLLKHWVEYDGITAGQLLAKGLGGKLDEEHERDELPHECMNHEFQMSHGYP